MDENNQSQLAQPNYAAQQPAQSTSVLNNFDFTAIDLMDPSLEEGHVVLYDREAPLELQIQDDKHRLKEVGSLEAIRVKVLLLGGTGANQIQNVRVELTSENDLFFHYTHQVDADSYRHMQEKQKLLVNFTEYANVFQKMVNSCIKEPHSFLAVLVMNRDGSAKLDFIQRNDFKFIELLSADFMASKEEIVRESITYRYNSAKSKVALMEKRLTDVNQLVKVKNPSLLLQLQKNGTQAPYQHQMSSEKSVQLMQQQSTSTMSRSKRF